MELSFAAATDVGRQRSHNEDNFLIDRKLRLFIVADGMGGHAAGEIASSITVHEIRDAISTNRDLVERFKESGDSSQGMEILQALEHAIQSACSTVHQRATEETDKRGMGTTVSVLLIAGPPSKPRGFIAHVGDSRIYLVRQGQCHQLTEDHSLMNELIRRGKVSAEEFDNSPYKQYKNAVTRAVGIYPSVEVDTFDLDILPGDRFLLCSDGMSAYLDEPQLPSLLDAEDVADIPAQLIEIANEGGGHDNITTVVVRVGEEATDEVGEHAEEVALTIEVLKGMKMFRYLSYKELVRFTNITRAFEVEPGATVIRAGEEGNAMYVVLSGRVELHHDDGVVVAKLDRGQHFGEMSLVDRTRRSLTATALEPSRVIEIRRDEFYEVIKKEPALSVKVLWAFLQVMAERLRKTTSELSGALRGERPSAIPTDQLDE